MTITTLTYHVRRALFLACWGIGAGLALSLVVAGRF